MNNVPELIRSFRKKRKLNQEEMADLLGISQRMYSKLENGENEIKLSRLHDIAAILQVNITDLLGENRKQNFAIEEVYSNPLYERIIRKQEDEITYLKGIINILQQ